MIPDIAESMTAMEGRCDFRKCRIVATPKTIPRINQIQKPKPFEYRHVRLSGDTDMYIVPASGGLELVKIELVVDRGRFDEEKRLSSRFCARILKEGTKDRNNDDINDIFDFYGASFHVQYHLDYASFSLICLRRYCLDLIPLVFEIISSPVFDKDELALLKKKALSRHKLALADNDSLSFRVLTERIFGAAHAYGYNSTEEDIHAISSDDLFRFHEKNYRRPFLKIYIAGNIGPDIYDEIGRQVSLLPAGSAEIGSYDSRPRPASVPDDLYVKNEYAYDSQSSIKMGKQIVKRDHPDYPSVHFLNTLLGGFFGSRLMQNIREKKGMTYNIFSDLEPMKYGAYFMIGTDVKTENIEEVITLIRREIETLEQKLISDKEMRMVRNYIKGTLLSSLDGVFSKSEMIKILTLEGMEIQWIFDFFDRLDGILPTDVPGLVKKYMKTEELFTVVVN